MVQRHRAFLQHGNRALDELRIIDARLAELQDRADHEFPLDASAINDLRGQLAKQILHIHDLELEAINLLKRAIQ
jgi:hypothetical protein